MTSAFTDVALPGSVYATRDVSASTSLAVNADRTIRPVGALIHTTSGTNSLAWLQGDSAHAGKAASADYLISRGGGRSLISPRGRYAYHAGQSELTIVDRYSNDQVSQALIGVELECLDTQAPTYQQVDSLAELIAQLALLWAWRWPYTIYGHYAVAKPLGRRSDPVNLNWGSLMGRLYIHTLALNVPGL